MAARWSSENVVVEFRDAQVKRFGSSDLPPVLCRRRFLYMVNLEAPSEPPKKIGRHSKWDVGTVQWNPHRTEAHVFAASSNQRVDLYSWRDGCGEAHTSLQGHTRVISDLDWSWFEPELLVTSSVDTYIYIWDTRDTRKPTVALSAVAGASQVKWNRKNQNLLASSHDGDVRIWDRRKPNTAAEYVAAHLSKIHGLDWHPDNEFILATSSQDNSVRFWDYRQPRKYLNILSCQVPVWKARYTPFSNGLVTVMVPQLRRENSLLLWSTLDLNSPVHAFVGHDDVVLEFQWRPQKEGGAVTSSHAHTHTHTHTHRHTQTDTHTHTHTHTHTQKLQSNGLNFALNYLKPVQCDSQFVHSDSKLIQNELKLLKLVQSLSKMKKGFPVDSKFVQNDSKLVKNELKMSQMCFKNVQSTRLTERCVCVLRSLSALSAYHSGVLTPMKMRSESQSTLRLYSGSPTRSDKDTVSISSFYYKERKSRRFKTKREGTDYGNRPIKLAGKVIIQEISCLLPVHKSLGESYILNMNDIQETCQKNAAAALVVGRRDVVWALASAATSQDLSPDSDPDTETPWARHPFGRHLLETLLDHYSHMSDVQTLAMLCSVFRAQAPPPDGYPLYGHHQSRASMFPPHHSRYVSPSVTSGSCSSTSDSITTTTWNTGRDSEHGNPWGEPSPDDYRYGNQGYTDPREREREQHDMNKRDKRADVLKFASCPPEPHKGIEFGVYCCHCRSQARGTQCAVCKRLTFQCAICHVAVRGSSNFCLSCGHGGHTSHMMDWFRRQDECPAGCGCHCLLQSTF
uniref:WD repeat domain 59 n=1 Tax=Stegastes partitus TaxID=144197 RepID=A0A3B5BGE8_9TELE